MAICSEWRSVVFNPDHNFVQNCPNSLISSPLDSARQVLSNELSFVPLGFIMVKKIDGPYMIKVPKKLKREPVRSKIAAA